MSVVKAQAQDETVGTVSVVIERPFQACHEGHVYASGEAAEVPAEVAAAWQRNGWASVGTAAVVDAPNKSTGFSAPGK